MRQMKRIEECCRYNIRLMKARLKIISRT